MKRLFLILSSGLCLLSSAPAAELPELAPGLRYLRVHSLEQSALELAGALNITQSPALVIDLRYIADEKGAAQALSALNSQPAKPKLYLLISPETPKEVATALAQTSTPFVTLGIRGSRPQPEVVVEQSPADDRAAYAALDNGTALTALVSGKIDKAHFDEAELVKEFKGGNHDARPPAPSSGEGPEGNPDGTKATPPPLTDRVLQRALHLHRALQVLKR